MVKLIFSSSSLKTTDVVFLKRERERERFCFRFERRDFDFENVLKPEVVKPKTPTMTPKTSNLLSLC